MISDHPDEDADNLDDENLLEAYLGVGMPTSDRGGTPTSERGEATAAGGLDWPGSHARDIGLTVNAETLAWFKANHSDWRLAIESVLRAWVDARTANAQRSSREAETGNP